MEHEGKMTVEAFIASRELPADKVTILRYLAKCSDGVTVEPRSKGCSRVDVYFDAGAYKGGSTITFVMKYLTPLKVANALESVGEGYHFHFKAAHEAALKQMEAKQIPFEAAHNAAQYARGE